MASSWSPKRQHASTLEATKLFLDAKILYGPAKAGMLAAWLVWSGNVQNSARLS